MSEKTKVKYNPQGKVKEATVTRDNTHGSTSATYSYDNRGVPRLTKAEQKRK